MEPIFLAYAGVALAIGVSGAACAFGTTIAGNAAVGSMKKNPDAFGNYMILCAIPGTAGLYGFLGYFLLSGFLVPEITMFQAIAVFFAGLTLGGVNWFATFRQAGLCANGIAAIGSGHDVFGKTLILAVFPELYSIIALAATFMIGASI
jgi:V/A-type H+-transporting ATPase subunit K